MNDVRRLGRYVLGREIGRGERGAVFEATEPGAGRTLALKLFRIDIVADPDAYVRALGRSVLATSGLRHPGVVRAIEQGVAADGQPWVVSERPDARSLRQLLDVLPRMSFEWVRSIGLQVAEALACAHAAGVVHGGLKASNILIDGEGRVSVTDFGLPVPSPDALPAMPQYLSPEQVQGLPPDARSDVFSLGALMFEMLAGRPPFGSPLTGSLGTVLENIAHAPTPTPSALDPEVPSDLDIVVMKALAKSPVDRYADAAALSVALRGAVVDAPAQLPQEDVHSEPLPRAEEAPPPYRRGRSDKPAAPVDDVLAELAADIDAFAARGAPDASIGQPSPLRAPLRSGRESATEPVAFPTLTDAPAPRPLDAAPRAPAARQPPQVVASSVPAAPAAASSLLADLAGEAQRIRAHAMQMQRGEQAARTGAEQALSRRLLLVRDYFTQLSSQLNVIRPQVARDYALLGLGVLRGLSWQASDVNARQRGAEAPDQIARVALSWQLRGQSVLRCERDALSADALRVALKEHGLRFEEQPSRDDYGRLRAQVFEVAPEVRGRAELVADYATLTLRLTLQNVERFGVVDYTPPADDAGNEWLDELVRLLLGQPSRFPTLARLIVPSAG